MKKERNLWPYGILGVILIGVVFIVGIVWFSMKHPVSDSGAFFLGYNDTDKQINEILEDTKAIQEHFDFYMQANVTPTKSDALKPYSPYLRPPHREKDKDAPKNILFTRSLNNIQVLINPKNANSKDLEITAFIQKIGKDTKQKIFIFNPKDQSFFPGEIEEPGGQILLGKLFLDKKNTFISPSFELDVQGRWIVSLRISYQGKIAILEREFFSIEKDNESTK